MLLIGFSTSSLRSAMEFIRNSISSSVSQSTKHMCNNMWFYTGTLFWNKEQPAKYNLCLPSYLIDWGRPEICPPKRSWWWHCFLIKALWYSKESYTNLFLLSSLAESSWHGQSLMPWVHTLHSSSFPGCCCDQFPCSQCAATHWNQTESFPVLYQMLLCMC